MKQRLHGITLSEVILSHKGAGWLHDRVLLPTCHQNNAFPKCRQVDSENQYIVDTSTERPQSRKTGNSRHLDGTPSTVDLKVHSSPVRGNFAKTKRRVIGSLQPIQTKR